MSVLTQEQQSQMVRDWCKANGVCPPGGGMEWTWYGRVVIAEDDSRAFWRSLPRFTVSNTESESD